MGTQKNRLIETVLLNTQNICFNEWVRKLFTLSRFQSSLSGPMYVIPSCLLMLLSFSSSCGQYDRPQENIDQTIRTVGQSAEKQRSMRIFKPSVTLRASSVGTPRPIPWNQTSDVHRGSTLIT